MFVFCSGDKTTQIKRTKNVLVFSYGKQKAPAFLRGGSIYLPIKSSTLKKLLILSIITMLGTSCVVYNPYKPHPPKQYRCVVGKTNYWIK